MRMGPILGTPRFWKIGKAEIATVPNSSFAAGLGSEGHRGGGVVVGANLEINTNAIGNEPFKRLSIRRLAITIFGPWQSYGVGMLELWCRGAKPKMLFSGSAM